MARRRRQEDRPTGPFAEFVAGLGAGAGVIGVEMVLFVFGYSIIPATKPRVLTA